jgi:hypothetical protein
VDIYDRSKDNREKGRRVVVRSLRWFTTGIVLGIIRRRLPLILKNKQLLDNLNFMFFRGIAKRLPLSMLMWTLLQMSPEVIQSPSVNSSRGSSIHFANDEMILATLWKKCTICNELARSPEEFIRGLPVHHDTL